MGNKVVKAQKLHAKAEELHGKGQTAQAAGLLEKAQRLLRYSEVSLHQETGDMLKFLGQCYEEMARHKEALPCYEEALAIDIVWGSPVCIADGHDKVGMCLAATGKFLDAMKYLDVAVETMREWDGVREDEAALMREVESESETESESESGLDIDGEGEEEEDEVEDGYSQRARLLCLYLSHSAEVTERMGENRTAVRLRREALAAHEERGETLAEELDRLLVALVKAHVRVREYKEAIHLAERALQRQREEHGKDHPGIAYWVHRLAFIYTLNGELEEAAKMWQEQVKILRSTVGNEHEETATAIYELGLILEQMRQHEKAMALFQETLFMRLELFGREDADTCQALSALGRVHMHMQEFSRAAQLLKDAEELTRTRVGDFHPETADAMRKLGRVFVLSGQVVKAAPLYEEALAIYRERLASTDSRLPRAMLEVADVYESLNDLPAACELVEEAVALSRDIYGAENVRSHRAIECLEHCYTMLGRYEDAIALSYESLALKRAEAAEKGVKATADLAWALDSLGILFCRVGDYSQAAQVLEEAVEVSVAMYGEKDVTSVTCMGNLALAYGQVGRREEGIAVCQKACLLAEEVTDKDECHAICSLSMGVLLHLGGDHEAALPYLHRASDLRRYAGDQRRLANVLVFIGDALAAQDKNEEAMEVYREALGLREETLVDGHPDTIQARVKIGNMTLGVPNVPSG